MRDKSDFLPTYGRRRKPFFSHTNTDCKNILFLRPSRSHRNWHYRRLDYLQRCVHIHQTVVLYVAMLLHYCIMTHVKATVVSCFAALRQIRSVRRSLSQHVNSRLNPLCTHESGIYTDDKQIYMGLPSTRPADIVLYLIESRVT